jgi:RNA polymerase sigma-70 factor (ECF subfamily)
VTTTTADEEFAQRTHVYRPELLAYCYRMLGSIHDAEDAVQDTLVRAWRAADGFEGRASLRTWLYRIATNACLRALENRGRRPLPSGIGSPGDDPAAPTAPALDLPWLQPAPDALLAGDDPASTVTRRETTRLALVAALQYLPARQRAVLILRDVLGWRAAEVATLLDSTTAAVNSTLQRARTQLERVSPREDEVDEPTDERDRSLLARYVAAFENADVPALMELLRDDAVLEMPPTPTWFAGRERVGAFLGAQVLHRPGRFRLVATGANGQPAFGTYVLEEDGVHHGHGVAVLTLAGGRIARLTAFNDAGLIQTFGLPPTLAGPRRDPSGPPLSDPLLALEHDVER